MVLRRHWFVFFKFVITYFLIGLIPLALHIASNSLTLNLFASETGHIAKVMIFSAFYLFWWLLAFRQFMDYWLDVWLITDQRVVNVRQRGLFFRTISELKLFRIQDVTADVRGLFPTLLHYGHVHIQTAATQKRFMFEQIPHPYEVTRKIMKLVEWRQHHMSSADRAALHHEAPQPSKRKKKS